MHLVLELSPRIPLTSSSFRSQNTAKDIELVFSESLAISDQISLLKHCFCSGFTCISVLPGEDKVIFTVLRVGLNSFLKRGGN